MKDFHVTRWRRERQPIKQNLWRRLRPVLCGILKLAHQLPNMSKFWKVLIVYVGLRFTVSVQRYLPHFWCKKAIGCIPSYLQWFLYYKAGVIAIHHQSFPLRPFPFTKVQGVVPKLIKTKITCCFPLSPLPKTSALGLAEWNIILEQTNKRMGRGGRQNKPPFLYVLLYYR